MPTKRSRDWSAYYSDSDEDGQVSITATVGQNGAVSYSRHPVVTKEWTHDESSVASDDEAEPAESSLSGKLTKAKPRKHVSIVSLIIYIRLRQHRARRN